MRRKFTCRRLVRLERAARLEVDHAELHCDHQVLIVACAAVDVAVVIVRIVVRFDGHVEGFDQLLHPRNARDRLIRRQRCGRQERCDHQHREHEAQKSFFHMFSSLLFAIFAHFAARVAFGAPPIQQKIIPILLIPFLKVK